MEEMEADLQSARQEYIVDFSNQSGKSGTVCIYLDTQGYPGVQSFAWRTNPVTPTTGAQFDWFSDYSFIWGRSRYLEPGERFYVDQSVDCRSNNLITLDRDFGKLAFKFKDPGRDKSGYLSIRATSTIPLNVVAVGIAMGGRPLQAIKAEPNLLYTFTPRKHYLIAFGDFDEGQSLDMQNIKNHRLLNFGDNISKMRVILHPNNRWEVDPVI
jgi:hypothetical protein